MAKEESREMLKTDEGARVALQKIKEAEERSRLLIDQARQKTSAQLMRKAAEEAEDLKKKILADARVRVEKLKKDIIGRAEAEARKANEEAVAEKQQILKQAEKNFKQAVEKTANKLLTIIEHRKR